MPDENGTKVEFATEVGYLRKFIDALSALRDEGMLAFRGNDVFSKVSDGANVAMGVSRIRGQALNSFSLVNGDSLQVGIDFESFSDKLSGASSTSEVEIEYPVYTGENPRLKIFVIDEDITFKIPTLDPSSVPDIPQNDPLSHPTRVVADGTDLKKSIENAKKVADPDSPSATFKTKSDRFIISSYDKVNGSFDKVFRQSGPSESGTSLSEHQTEISLGYLEDIKKIIGSADEVRAHIKNDHPIRFDVDLDDAGDAQIIYIIAPRLESS